MPGAEAKTKARAKALYGSAVLARLQGDFGAAEAFLRESLEIARELEEQGAIADALFELGNVANQQEDLATARSFYEQTLALRRELNDRLGIALASHGLGVLAYAMGDPAAARTLYEEAIAIQRERGNLRAEAAGLNGLGDVALYQGDLGAARAFQNRSLEIQRGLGDKSGTAFSLRLLGRVAVREGDLASARGLLSESLELFQEVGDPGGIADGIEAMAELSAAGGDAERALRLAGAAAAHREAIHMPLAGPDREQLDRSLAPARETLGSGEADRIFTAGKVLGLERAVLEATDADFGQEKRKYVPSAQDNVRRPERAPILSRTGAASGSCVHRLESASDWPVCCCGSCRRVSSVQRTSASSLGLLHFARLGLPARRSVGLVQTVQGPGSSRGQA
jgi:tetratricopeptide (TPR) repeat protein